MNESKFAGSFSVDLPMDKIQAIRLTHALMESDYDVHIPEQHNGKFLHLRNVFGLQYAVGGEGVPKLPLLKTSHSCPLTEVGSLQRLLIFPHAAFTYCRQLWPGERSIRFSFAGLVTKKRRAVLKSWLKSSFPDLKIKLPGQKNRLLRLRDKLLQVLQWHVLPTVHEAKCGDVVFWSSDRGRKFPIKAWDEEYYKMLAHSQFALCPNGTFIWTYRFFEAMMCGAMPIIENYCPAYEGFRFFSMNDPVDKLNWSQEAADYNFRLCMERLTIPLDVLNREIASLLASKC